jgi:hypothetical protein
MGFAILICQLLLIFAKLCGHFRWAYPFIHFADLLARVFHAPIVGML